ncbi:hypothetical protein Emed_002830 [Eimeria media]
MASASAAKLLQRLRTPLSFWAPRSAGFTSSSQALPSPILRTNHLRPQKSTFTPTLREGEFAVLPAQEVPKSIRRPAYATAADGRPLPPGVSSSNSSDPVVDKDPVGWSIDPKGEIQGPEELKRMRKVCRLAATALKIAVDASKPGVTTEEIDALVHRFLVSQGAYPAAINFFVACHGVPDLRPLREGDIVSYDCTAYFDGFFGDCAATTVIAPVSQEHQRLVAAAKECLNVAVRAVKPGVPIAHIGQVITFADISLEEDFTSRLLFLMDFVTNDAEHVFRVGQTFTIEPILCEGSGDIRCWEDGWTTVTQDCGRCAQFEHTLVVTEDGAVPLTCAENA